MPEPKDVERCEYMHVHEAIVNQVNQNMPDEEVLYDLAELFKIFGDSTRIKILYVLFESEMCVRHLPPAPLSQAEQAGQGPQGGQDRILFSGRRARAHHIGPGDGARGGAAASAYSIKKWRLYHEKAL